jgi:hypothetical protein
MNKKVKSKNTVPSGVKIEHTYIPYQNNMNTYQHPSQETTSEKSKEQKTIERKKGIPMGGKKTSYFSEFESNSF